MESFLMAAIVVAGLAVAVGLIRSMQPENHARWALGRAKNTPIAELKHGEWARVTGVVSAIAPITTSPVGDHGCVGFRLEVTRTNRRLFAVVMRREACEAFSISDETGKAHVDGPFFLGIDFGPVMTLPPHRLKVIEQAGVPVSGILLQPQFGYQEALLRPGDRVSVFGLVFLEPDPTVPAAGLRSPPLIARLHGSKGQRIIVAHADDA